MARLGLGTGICPQAYPVARAKSTTATGRSHGSARRMRCQAGCTVGKCDHLATRGRLLTRRLLAVVGLGTPGRAAKFGGEFFRDGSARRFLVATFFGMAQGRGNRKGARAASSARFLIIPRIPQALLPALRSARETLRNHPACCAAFPLPDRSIPSRCAFHREAFPARARSVSLEVDFPSVSSFHRWKQEAFPLPAS